jgi:hypothetical protein
MVINNMKEKERKIAIEQMEEMAHSIMKKDEELMKKLSKR